MFELYTATARRIVFFGRVEAGNRGATEITAEHLALGILKADVSLFSLAASRRVAADVVRKELEATAANCGPRQSYGVDIPLAASGRKALELADVERRRMQQAHVGAGHVLAGVLGAGSPAATILAMRGVTLDALRAALAKQVERN